jgi:hypothetical protein
LPNPRDDVLRESLGFYRPTLGTDGLTTSDACRDSLGFLTAGDILQGEADAHEGRYWANQYQERRP